MNKRNRQFRKTISRYCGIQRHASEFWPLIADFHFLTLESLCWILFNIKWKGNCKRKKGHMLKKEMNAPRTKTTTIRSWSSSGKIWTGRGFAQSLSCSLLSYLLQLKRSKILRQQIQSKREECGRQWLGQIAHPYRPTAERSMMSVHVGRGRKIREAAIGSSSGRRNSDFRSSVVVVVLSFRRIESFASDRHAVPLFLFLLFYPFICNTLLNRSSLFLYNDQFDPSWSWNPNSPGQNWHSPQSPSNLSKRSSFMILCTWMEWSFYSIYQFYMFIFFILASPFTFLRADGFCHSAQSNWRLL